MKRKNNFLIILILILCVLLRLYKFENPLADWHSWRQVDTSSVSRSFTTHGFDILHPRYHDISNVPSGKDNPQGLRFVEFPLYNIAQAGLYLLFNTFTLEQWGRIITIISSLATVTFIYLIIKRHLDEKSAILAAFFYTVLPFSIYYGRTILPDSAMISAILGGNYFFDLCFNTDSLSSKRISKYSKSVLFLLSIILTSSALLFKPYAIFFMLPMLFLIINKLGLKSILNWKLWFFVLVSFLPLILWRIWITQYPEGIPVSDWLFNKNNIRFKGAFFYWIFADRISRLILGYWGTVLFVLGILSNSVKDKYTQGRIYIYSYILSSLIYLIVIAGGNVQHDYYQILIIPSIAMFLGMGADFLIFQKSDLFNPILSKSSAVILILFTLGFSWYHIREFYNTNYSIVSVGKIADKILPKDALVIAPMEGDTTFLYHINRKGWASFQNPLPEMIKKGATHLILLNPSEKDFEFAESYRMLSGSTDYVLFDLQNKP